MDADLEDFARIRKTALDMKRAYGVDVPCARGAKVVGVTPKQAAS